MTAMITDYPSQEVFLADPRRRHSGVTDFGYSWHDGEIPFPRWRVSYLQATGEVFAVRMRGPGAVRVLGVVPADPTEDAHGNYHATLDRALQGWGAEDYDLSWVTARLQAAGLSA